MVEEKVVIVDLPHKNQRHLEESGQTMASRVDQAMGRGGVREKGK